MDEKLLKVLSWVDTPTVCNAIEVAQGKRGFNAFSRGTVQCTDAASLPLVGFARTAKIRGSRPSDDPHDDVNAKRMAYYEYMAKSPAPSIAVIEDVDYPNCVGAYWGEINAQVHKGFGMSGALTNGVVRDLVDLPEQYPIIAGSFGPSHAYVHVTEIDIPVEVFGLKITPGELIHADRNGAVSIPIDVLDGLNDALGKLLETEKLILEPARQPGFDFEKFKKAWTAFEASRT